MRLGLLTGDRSLVDVVVHELTHSWFGNGVTRVAHICTHEDHYLLLLKTRLSRSLLAERRMDYLHRASPFAGALYPSASWIQLHHRVNIHY